MALLFLDPGGKFFANTTQAVQGLYASISNVSFVNSGIPVGAVEPTAYLCSNTSNAGFVVACPNQGSGPYTCGIRLYAPTANGSYSFNWNNGGGPQTTMQIVAGGLMQVLRSNSTVLATSTFTLNGASWNYIEFQTFCHPTLGTFSVRVNNNVVLSGVNQNTQGQTNTAIVQGVFNFGLGAIYLQDIYVIDNTTPPGNIITSFAGDCSMPVLYANRNGAFTNYAANGAAQPWQCVADPTPDDATTFVSDSTVGDRCSFGFGSTASSNPVIAVGHYSRVLKSDSGTRTISQIITSGGVDSVAPAIAPGTSYAYTTQFLTLDPATGVPFTVNSLNNLQAGIKTVT